MTSDNQDSEPQRIVLEGEKEDRYSRFRLITWWDQDLLQRSRVMVVGAGALGNEIVKNLTLLGVGKIFLVDQDTIECSNLSRSVLYREEDEGKSKADTAAGAARMINPVVNIEPLMGNVIHDVGLGVFRSMDLVICGLDNREARLWVNQCCWRVNRPWIDGAIEVLNGIARVFIPPDGSCYECTMNETDHRLLNLRKSCSLLNRDQMLEGKVPTTPTTASVIAGVQCQEAVKLLHNRHDLPVLAGKGFYFNGLTHDSFVVEYPRKEDCLSHETYEDIVEMPWKADGLTLREALEYVRADLGPEAVIDFPREIITSLSCDECSTSVPKFALAGKVKERDAVCPMCSKVMTPELTHTITGDEPFLDMTLRDIGIPRFDIFAGRSGLLERHYELSGDRDDVLGQVK